MNKFIKYLNQLTNPNQIQRGHYTKQITHYNAGPYTDVLAHSTTEFLLHMEPGRDRPINIEEALPKLKQAIKENFPPVFLFSLFKALLQTTDRLSRHKLAVIQSEKIKYKYTAYSEQSKSNEAAAASALLKIRGPDFQAMKKQDAKSYFDELLTTICDTLFNGEASEEFSLINQALVSYKPKNGGSIWHEIIPQLNKDNLTRIKSFIHFLADNKKLHPLYLQTLESRDNAGNNPLHIAAENGKLHLLLDLLNRLEFIDLNWIQKKLGEPNDKGFTPWHVMIAKQVEEEVVFSGTTLEPDSGVLKSTTMSSTTLNFLNFSQKTASSDMNRKVDQWLNERESNVVETQSIPEAYRPPEAKPQTYKEQQTTALTFVAAVQSKDGDRLQQLISKSADKKLLIAAICQHQLLQIAVKTGNRVMLPIIFAALRSDDWIEVGKDLSFRDLPKVARSQERLNPALLFGLLIQELNKKEYRIYQKTQASRVAELKAALSHYKDYEKGQPTTASAFFKLHNLFLFTRFKKLGGQLCSALNQMSTYQGERHHTAGAMLAQLDHLFSPIQTAEVVNEKETYLRHS